MAPGRSPGLGGLISCVTVVLTVPYIIGRIGTSGVGWVPVYQELLFLIMLEELINMKLYKNNKSTS